MTEDRPRNSHIRQILSHITGKSASYFFTHSNDELSPQQREIFDHRIHQLSQGMPLSRILGEREFWSLPFALNQDTLDPRPDSECLVESVLKYRPDHQASMRILDLGTGSGCLLISLLSEYKNATGIGVDLSFKALDAARQNAQSILKDTRAHFTQSHWFEAVEGLFDVIISNPPYIAQKDYDTLDYHVRGYDPVLALVGGDDGLQCYREIIEKAGPFLKSSGLLALEIGVHQAQSVSDLLKAHGFTKIKIEKDLAGIERCLISSYD